MDFRSCVALVPVKPPAVGKSRLGGPDERRAALAAAFAHDTVTACLRTPHVAEVLAVTDDAGFAAELTEVGCSVVPDGHPGDLNHSLLLAAAESWRRWPGLRPLVVCADLPALRPEDLATALAGVQPEEAAFVADARGSGTTMYTAPYDAFAPRFGKDSRAAHLADGAREIADLLPSLRLDVDDQEDLAAARRLGLGARTTARDTQ